MRRDLALSEPSFVGRVKRRDEAASGLEDLSVAADCVRTVDEIEDGVGAVWVRRAQRAGHVDGCSVVDFFGTEVASLGGVAPDGRDDARGAAAVLPGQLGRRLLHVQRPGGTGRPPRALQLILTKPPVCPGVTARPASRIGTYATRALAGRGGR